MFIFHFHNIFVMTYYVNISVIDNLIHVGRIKMLHKHIHLPLCVLRYQQIGPYYCLFIAEPNQVVVDDHDYSMAGEVQMEPDAIETTSAREDQTEESEARPQHAQGLLKGKKRKAEPLPSTSSKTSTGSASVSAAHKSRLDPLEVQYYQAQIRLGNLKAEKNKLEIALLEKKLSET